MKAKLIRIQNILGIEEMEIAPGKLTLISGKNGAGKTSTIEAIKAALGGGHDATLIRHGANAGTVVIVLEDGVEITKRITPGGSTVKVAHPEFGAMGKPQTYLNRLADALSFNPVSFLMAPPEKRAAWLLEAVPMELDEQEIVDTLDDAIEVSGAELQGHALDVIERVRRRVYDERTGVNRAAKEKRATAGQLAGSLPETDVSAEDLEAEIQERETRRGAISTERARKETEIRQEFEDGREGAVERANREIAALQRKIDELKDQANQAVTELREARDAAIEAINEPFADEDTELEREIVALREQQKEAGRHANTREVVRTMEAEADRLGDRSEALTDAITRIDDLKLSLLGRLPIQGIEIRDGALYFEDVPFDRLNRAKQVEVALAVAKLRAGDLPLVCVDGLECLDAESFAAFQRWAERGDLQLIATRVTDDAMLTVSGAEVEGPGLAAVGD